MLRQATHDMHYPGELPLPSAGEVPPLERITDLQVPALDVVLAAFRERKGKADGMGLHQGSQQEAEELAGPAVDAKQTDGAACPHCHEYILCLHVWPAMSIDWLWLRTTCRQTHGVCLATYMDVLMRCLCGGL